MQTLSKNVSGGLASIDYFLQYFFKNFAPTLLPLAAFVILFLLGQEGVALLALACSASFLFSAVYQRSKSLPGWDIFSSLALALFILILALSVLALVSLATLRLEWTLLALFFLTLSFFFLLLSCFFKR